MCEFSADSKHEENGNRKRETGGKQNSEWYSEWGERGYFPQTANIYLLKTALLHRSEEERLEL